MTTEASDIYRQIASEHDADNTTGDPRFRAPLVVGGLDFAGVIRGRNSTVPSKASGAATPSQVSAGLSSLNRPNKWRHLQPFAEEHDFGPLSGRPSAVSDIVSHITRSPVETTNRFHVIV